MKRYEIRKLANSLLEKHGIAEKGWKFCFDNAKRRLGCCKYQHKLITLSHSLSAVATDEEITDAILHEIAHAIVGFRHGHDSVWRAKALEIGCNGQRCHQVDTTKDAPYIATCGCEGKTHSRFKRPPKGRNHYCKRCRESIVWKPNK